MHCLGHRSDWWSGRDTSDIFAIPERFNSWETNNFRCALFVILPSIYLANSDETKSSILQNKLYLRFTDHFFYQTINKITPANDDNDKELDSVNKFCDSCGENLQEVDHKEHCTPFKNYPLTNIFH